MVGFDDHGSIVGDWVLPSPSPRSFFSAILGDDIGQRSINEPKGETKSDFVFPAPEGQDGSGYAFAGVRGLASSAVDQATTMPGPFREQKMNSRGGLLERMAARTGFSAPRLNTESIRPAGISQNPEVRSPCLTIPPGLSPTTLLDSPIFLSNSLVQPSPTTGKFQFFPNGNGKSSMMVSDLFDRSKENIFDDINRSSFAFRTVTDSGPNSCDAITKVTPSFSSQQPFPSIEVSVQSDKSFPPGSTELVKLHSQDGPTNQLKSDLSGATLGKNAEGNNVLAEDMDFNAAVRSEENSSPLIVQQDEDVDQRFGSDANANNAPSEDGYNWRKYGQKQVKGSEYPRSYFKCTHPNCPVKKKVERSHEGHITEIIYKGAHNHPKPSPNRRAGIGSSNALSDMTEQGGAIVNGDQVWMQKGTSDWRQDNLEVTSSAQLGPQQAQNGSQFESSDAIDVSSTFTNEEEEEDRATHGSVSLGYDGEGDESESKRRKLEAYAADVSGNTRAIREPRVVVQTTSEVDILDDGYRWRKYGQKVVKGNPNPRSYYKCTNAGCNVRKHVERASHDLKSVITTYEGKHNHDVPVARNNSSSSHMNNSNTLSLQSQASQSQTSQLEKSMARFGSSYGLAGGARHQFGQPTFGFGYQNQAGGVMNLGMSGLSGNANQGKLQVFPNHHFMGEQREMNSENGFLLPKEELKVEPTSEMTSNLIHQAAVYQQMMMNDNNNRLPLGPHM